MKIDFNSYFGKSIDSLKDFCEENHLTITDADGDGVFTKKDILKYQVQQGESLWRIAGKYEGYSAKQLQNANGGNTLIRKGQYITIPFAEENKTTPNTSTTAAEKTQNSSKDKITKYQVQKGDTLYKIARKFGCDVKKLQEANGGSTNLTPGQYLTIPGSTEAKAAADKAKTSAGKVSAEFKHEISHTRSTKTPTAPISFKNFGNVKTRKVTDDNIMNAQKNKSISDLQKENYYVVDNNGNGVYDADDGLYKQVTVMLDAGHGESKYLKAGQQVTLPNKKVYTTKQNDTWENIAAANGTDAKKLKAANPNVKNGYDPGATGIGEHNEAYFNGVAREKLAAKLRAKGFAVILAERTDRPHIYDRPAEKLSQKPDMYVSLHCDSASSASAKGETAYYRNDDDEEITSEINKELKNNTTFVNRGVKGAKDKDILVLRGDNKGEMRETLIELGFVSSQSDYDKLNGTGIDAQTDAIAKGIENYYNKHLEK